MENSMDAPQKIKNRTTLWSAILLVDIYLKEMKTLIRKDICTPVFTAALFTIAKTWKQPKCPSTEKWIKKMWYIYAKHLYTHCLISSSKWPHGNANRWNHKGQWFAQSDTISTEGEDLHPVEFYVLVLCPQWNRGEVQMRWWTWRWF